MKNFFSFFSEIFVRSPHFFNNIYRNFSFLWGAVCPNVFYRKNGGLIMNGTEKDFFHTDISPH